MTAGVVVRWVTADLLDDWLSFFDGDAFHDNPDWAGCYCQWFHVDQGSCDWQSRTAEQNRQASVEMIRARTMHGCLAYVDGRAAGWCQAAPRSAIPGIANEPALAVDDADEVGSIVCFVVAAWARRQGVATALLEAACAGFRELGFRIAEAYPRPVAAGDSANYHGPLELYLRAGFEPYREVEDLVIVRRQLGGVSE